MTLTKFSPFSEQNELQTGKEGKSPDIIETLQREFPIGKRNMSL